MRESRATLDQAGIAVKTLGGEEKRLGAALDAAKAKMASLNRIAELRQQRAQAIGATLAVGVAGDFEHGLMRFGNTAGFSQEQVDEVRRKILDLRAQTHKKVVMMSVV